jgi:mannose-1-phosphate guanylyltransferase
LSNDKIFVVTLESQAALVADQIPEIPFTNIIQEPQPKSTALAMGFAAAFIHNLDPKASIVYLAADHIIEKQERFQNTIATALKVASENDYIVSVGIKPTFPHTGLGYIKVGEQLSSFGSGKQEVYVFKGDGFKEKPDATTAQAFFASGEYLWNANMYCFSTETIFKAFQKYAPQIGQNVSNILEALGTDSAQSIIEQEYACASNPPIDTAVSEKADNIVVIPGDFGWNDVGDWQVVYDIAKKDAKLNVVTVQEHVNIESINCLVEGDKRLIVTVGLENIVIVDTPDALLVCHKDKTQDVKKVVERLKEEKKEKYL